MNKQVMVGRTVFDVVTEEVVDGRKAWGLVAGSTVKTLCESNSMTGWALYGRQSGSGKLTLSCPNLVVFF